LAEVLADELPAEKEEPKPEDGAVQRRHRLFFRFKGLAGFLDCGQMPGVRLRVFQVE
jgi:hypothetical protein